MQEERNMADLRAFLEDGLRSEELLRLGLQSLKEANTQQLLEAETKQREALEVRRSFEYLENIKNMTDVCMERQ